MYSYFVSSEYYSDFFVYVLYEPRREKFFDFRSGFPTLSNTNWPVQSQKQARRLEKGTNRQRSGKGAIRKRFPLQNRGGEKLNQHPGTYTMTTYRKPNRWPISYLNLTNNMKKKTQKSANSTKMLSTKK